MGNPRCWVHGHIIKGKVYRWRWHPVCKSGYSWCCENLRGPKPNPFNWAWVIVAILGVILLLKLTSG